LVPFDFELPLYERRSKKEGMLSIFTPTGSGKGAMGKMGRCPGDTRREEK
jgi:hypothetical protein